MRKELLWAIIIGVFIGVVIGFGAWRVRSSVNKNPGPTPSPTPQTNVGKTKISINKPVNMAVTGENSISVSGLSKPDSFIIVSTETGEFIGKAGSDGSFEVDVDLEAGLNNLQAFSIDAQGDSSSQSLEVIYSSAFETQETATAGASIDESVAAKIAQAKTPPMAYIGTVTDITDSTIQIKTTDSQIRQVATDKYDVGVVNTTGKTDKVVKVADIAIGDFIISMGYVDGNEVLEAKRILISDPTVKTKINVAYLKVKAVSTKSIDAVPVSGGESLTITPNKNTDIYSFVEGKVKAVTLSYIEEEDFLIVVSDITGSPAITRSIFDITSQ